MSLPLPPDPYKALGVPKNATSSAIKTAYRKLILKCHPDKVQDPTLKAVKQDEFTKVQQAWEILGEKDMRKHYDTQVELYELRKSMGKGNPSPRSNPFEYEVRPADSRHAYTKSKSKESPKVYPHRQPPKSYEDVMYEEPPHKAGPRRTASYEAERKRPSMREGERDRRKAAEEEERLRQKFEKEARRSAAPGDKKKSRGDKDRREKAYNRSAYVEDEESDDLRAQARAAEKKGRRGDEEAARESARPTPVRKGSLPPKYEGHMEQAAQYMQAATARRKAQVIDEDFRPSMKRAETFAAAPTPAFEARYPLKSSDEESPRMSARRRIPEVSAKKSKDKKSRVYPDIVEPPKPSLSPQTSAPPFVSSKPNRSKTSDYPRAGAPPPPMRAATFQMGDRDRGRKSTKSKKPAEYVEETSESDSDVAAPPYQAPRESRSPRREPTRYIIDNGRTVPISKHREAMRDIDDEMYGRPPARSPSPKPRRSGERPRASQRANSSSRNQSYFPPEVPDPVPTSSRPKMPSRDASRTASHRAPYFPTDVKYGPKIMPENVVYSSMPDYSRRGEPQTYTYATHRGTRGDPVYA